MYVKCRKVSDVKPKRIATVWFPGLWHCSECLLSLNESNSPNSVRSINDFIVTHCFKQLLHTNYLTLCNNFCTSQRKSSTGGLLQLTRNIQLDTRRIMKRSVVWQPKELFYGRPPSKGSSNGCLTCSSSA